MEIRVDDLRGPEIARLLQEHLQDMALHSPPESIHALDLKALRRPEITFWTAWQDGELMGCGALKELDSRHGEIKSMRTAMVHRRKGVGGRPSRHVRGIQVRLSQQKNGTRDLRRLVRAVRREFCP